MPIIPEGFAERIYRQTCRFDFNASGFSLVDLGPDFGSYELRRLMVDLKRDLAQRYALETGRTLVFLSMGRFDQQVTTRPHRDGAPDESILLLGYEPTKVLSRLSMADYSQCAFDLAIEPARFLEEFNPMFAHGRELLAPYTTALESIDRRNFQILAINNSCTVSTPGVRRLVGVLHQADIPEPIPSEQRIVNSMMLGAVDPGILDVISEAQQEGFVRTGAVS